MRRYAADSREHPDIVDRSYRYRHYTDPHRVVDWQELVHPDGEDPVESPDGPYYEELAPETLKDTRRESAADPGYNVNMPWPTFPRQRGARYVSALRALDFDRANLRGQIKTMQTLLTRALSAAEQGADDVALQLLDQACGTCNLPSSATHPRHQ